MPAFFLFSKWEQYKRKSNIIMLKKRGIQLSYGKINMSIPDEQELLRRIYGKKIINRN
jgi:hypothetical protein